jgi:hypothetical protein
MAPNLASNSGTVRCWTGIALTAMAVAVDALREPLDLVVGPIDHEDREALTAVPGPNLESQSPVRRSTGKSRTFMDTFEMLCSCWVVAWMGGPTVGGLARSLGNAFDRNPGRKPFDRNHGQGGHDFPRVTTGRDDREEWWRWGRVELPVQNPSPASTTSVSDHFRQPRGRRSAPCLEVQSRAPRSGLFPDYATLIRSAAPLHDASTARGTEAASTLTLRPKPRGRESTACWQVLRFAA